MSLLCGLRARSPLRERLRRGAAAALVLMLVACVIGAQAREAAFLHVRCAEHGQLMHVHALAAPPTSQAPAKTRFGSSGSGQRDVHDHCPFVGAAHCAHATIATTAVATSVAIAAPGPIAPADYVRRATFRIAPKTSPPV